MSDMAAVIIPKSDQLNSDDLIAGPITITVTGVSIKPGEQPVAISYEGDKGKPYKCCKSMARILVTAWGADSKQYVGRSMTLYRDPSVKWAGMEVGGIRISHMSDISSPLTMALTMTKSNRKPFTVKPLVAEKKAAAPKMPVSASAGAIESQSEHTIDNPSSSTSSEVAAPTISPDEATALEDRLKENNIQPHKVKAFFNVKWFKEMTGDQLAAAHTMIDETLEKRRGAQ